MVMCLYDISKHGKKSHDFFVGHNSHVTQHLGLWPSCIWNFDIQDGMYEFKSLYHAGPMPLSIKVSLNNKFGPPLNKLVKLYMQSCISTSCWNDAFSYGWCIYIKFWPWRSFGRYSLCQSKDISRAPRKHEYGGKNFDERQDRKVEDNTWEYLVCTRPDYLGEVENHQTFYGKRCGTRAVQRFKLRFIGLYNTGFPSYTVGYRSTQHPPRPAVNTCMIHMCVLLPFYYRCAILLCGTSVTTGGMRWQRCEWLVRVFRQLESDVSN